MHYFKATQENYTVNISDDWLLTCLVQQVSKEKWKKLNFIQIYLIILIWMKAILFNREIKIAIYSACPIDLFHRYHYRKVNQSETNKK